MTSEDENENSSPILNKKMNSVELNKFYIKKTDLEETFEIQLSNSNIVGFIIENKSDSKLRKFKY